MSCAERLELLCGLVCENTAIYLLLLCILQQRPFLKETCGLMNCVGKSCKGLHRVFTGEKIRVTGTCMLGSQE